MSDRPGPLAAGADRDSAAETAAGRRLRVRGRRRSIVLDDPDREESGRPIACGRCGWSGRINPRLGGGAIEPAAEGVERDAAVAAELGLGLAAVAPLAAQAHPVNGL